MLSISGSGPEIEISHKTSVRDGEVINLRHVLRESRFSQPALGPGEASGAF